MKKILLVVPLSTTEFGTRNSGGVDSVCQILVSHLVETGSTEFFYRVLAFNPFNDGSYLNIPVKLSENVELIYFPSKIKKYGVTLPSLLSCNLIVSQQVNLFKPDIIHSHLAAWLFGGFKVKRRVATLHAYKKIGRNSKSFLNDLFYERILPAITDKFVNEYTVVGELLRQALKSDTQKKISLIGNPISSIFFSTNRVIPLTKRLRIVTCSLITRRKRIEISIMLLQKIRNLGIDAELIVIGPEIDKCYAGELQEMIKKGEFEDFVHFTGACNQQEITQYYQTSQLGLFFSVEETFGLAPLEMMACGLPLISSKVGILSECITEFSRFPSVCVFEEINIDEIALIIPKILSSSVSDCKEYLSNNFSVESILIKYQSIYKAF